MTKKRIIKKNLRNIMCDLYTATMVALSTEQIDADRAIEVQDKIAQIYVDFNSRLSNYERRKAKQFFKQYKQEANAALAEIATLIEG